MALQRKHFAKTYIVHTGSECDENRRYIQVEESYDGQFIEIVVSAPDLPNSCPGDTEEGESCSCEFTDGYRISLNREQVKELLFCIKQLHFIDKPKEK